MKIRTKLLVSFLIVIFVPIFLALVLLFGVFQFQLKNISEKYAVPDLDVFSLTNSVQLLNQYTAEDMQELEEVVLHEPVRMEQPAYLNDTNAKLKAKYSYLLVKRDGELVYNGGANNNDIVLSLREELVTESNGVSTYLDNTNNVIVKQLPFSYVDGDEGIVYIVTSTKNMVPEVKYLIGEAILFVLIILFLTALLIIMWLHGTIIIPIRKLELAAENIKEGNLDFVVGVTGTDEIGELGVTFEEMRQRLRENAEEKLRNESENKMLISNIAHDLKTPITAIKGYAEGIMDGVANTPEKIDKYMQTIYHKANEMNTLINELTLYSKIDTNRIPYHFAKINLVDYFKDCIDELGIELEGRGIALSYHNYVGEDVVIIADPEQLRRVINNIIGNSIKYIDKKPGIIKIRLRDVGDFVQIELEDNGKGMAAKDLPYIFDRFYRTDESRNSATGGSGIGLSIVKKIIEDHGGKIWVNSKEDVGTIMYMVIRKYQEVKHE